ncbi:MAG: hypothetical protein WCO64_06195 [Actinomycetes bacterium]
MKRIAISVSVVLACVLSACGSSAKSNNQADEACSSLNVLIQDLMMESVTSQDEFYSRMSAIHSAAMLAGALDPKYDGFGKQIESFENVWSENYPDGLPNAKGTEPLRYTWDTFCPTG